MDERNPDLELEIYTRALAPESRPGLPRETGFGAPPLGSASTPVEQVRPRSDRAWRSWLSRLAALLIIISLALLLAGPRQSRHSFVPGVPTLTPHLVRT